MKKILLLIIIISLSGVIISCSDKSKNSLLDPDKPITVSVWHYYNGTTKEAFDELVSSFNETVGMRQGIVVDARSQGDVNQLAEAVFDAANRSIGSMPMPDVFAAYPDNAFRVHQITPLVSLETYFSEEELNEYRKEFLEEGQFITDNLYYIIPIAKSSENLYINKNLWSEFRDAHGFTEDNLRTWEGIYQLAEIHYKETGKGFFGLDANANYFIVSSKQLDEPLYSYSNNGTAVFHFSENLGKKIWDYYYRPYIKGYFKKSGRFSSDDAKTGDILCYTGSTAGAPYFPRTVVLEGDKTMEIEPLVLPYPAFESGRKVSIQQGAGMSIAKSDKAHEYGAAVFLKWFTETENNLKFSVSTGYFPSKNEALKREKISEIAKKRDVPQGAILESIKASDIMFNEYRLYNNKPFEGSYKMRVLLESHLFNKIKTDLNELDKRAAAGEKRGKVIEELLSDKAFAEWIKELNKEAEKILNSPVN